jgi:methylmalonyl-CoA mutase N-terminal domain/subunit
MPQTWDRHSNLASLRSVRFLWDSISTEVPPSPGTQKIEHHVQPPFSQLLLPCGFPFTLYPVN